MTKKIIAVALAAMMLAVILPANAAVQANSVQIRGEVWDEGVNEFTLWDANNYAGFWYDLDDGLKSENLTLAQPNLSNTARSIDDKDVSLALPKGGLFYNSTRQLVKYKVSKEIPKTFPGKNRSVDQGINCPDGLPLSCYGKLGWLSDEYVALDGKAKKLSKLLYEQGTTSSDKKTLTVGDTWEVGGGWTISAQSIDAKADPRQAWLVLSYDGVKQDDKVVKAGTGSEPGEVYTFTADIGGETDVPLFVTYIDSIFAGATTDMVQLRYTWAISKTATEVKSGDKYGVFEVKTAGDTILELDLTSSITLSSDSTQDLAGDFKLKVADDDEKLRFYPMVVYEIAGEGGVVPGATVTGTAVGTATVTGMGNQTTTLTATPTIPPTQEPTTTPTPTATPKEPGFEAVFAIAGLLAVAFLVLRQRK